MEESEELFAGVVAECVGGSYVARQHIEALVTADPCILNTLAPASAALVTNPARKHVASQFSGHSDLLDCTPYRETRSKALVKEVTSGANAPS